ncbi:hypothetical protein ACQ0QQ_00705 [Lysinibacillus sphaericus]
MLADFNKLLVTCCNINGGLYEVDREKWNFRKILHESCCGIAKYDEYYVVVSDRLGILLMDHHYNIVNKAGTRGIDYHGTAVKGEIAYIVETQSNTISLYHLPDLKKVDEFRVSEIDKDFHHVNDLFIQDENLFVSMFSLEDEWSAKKDIPTGVIVEYSLEDFKKVRTHLEKKIHQPHSPMLLDGQLLYCSSYNRQVRHGSKVIFHTEGYPRGLALAGGKLYVGNSSSVNRKGNATVPGIYEVAPNGKSSRFLPLPSQEVYGIISI